MKVALPVAHPVFEAAAKAAAFHPAREGALPPDRGSTLYAATDEGITLFVAVVRAQNRLVVEAARHAGAGDSLLRGVLDVFCRAIEQLPLQEAADHGAIHTIGRMREKDAAAVPGILTPRSAGAAFMLCDRLIRQVLAQYRQATGDASTRNFWNPPVAPAWGAMNVEQRMDALRPVIAAFSAANGLGEEDMWLAEIDKTHRVIIGFGAGVHHSDKPSLLMRLEREIREMTGTRLEVFMEEMKDGNEIRRLGPGEEAA